MEKYTRRSFNRMLILIVSALFLSNCGTESNTSGTEFIDGIHEDILKEVDENILAIIEGELGVPIHRGSNPPQLKDYYLIQESGITFSMSPFQFYKSTVPDEYMTKDTNISSQYFRFNNQNRDDFTIDFDTGNGFSQIYMGRGYIIGQDLSFSVFAIQEHVYDEGVRTVLVVFSGIINEDEFGIEEPYTVRFMLDDGGIKGKTQLIWDLPTGTGRSFIDVENFAGLSGWPG